MQQFYKFITWLLCVACETVASCWFNELNREMMHGLAYVKCILFVIGCIMDLINFLKTKRRLLYLKTQSAPRCKHFILVIKTNQFTL